MLCPYHLFVISLEDVSTVILNTYEKCTLLIGMTLCKLFSQVATIFDVLVNKGGNLNEFLIVVYMYI